MLLDVLCVLVGKSCRNPGLCVCGGTSSQVVLGGGGRATPPPLGGSFLEG